MVRAQSFLTSSCKALRLLSAWSKILHEGQPDTEKVRLVQLEAKSPDLALHKGCLAQTVSGRVVRPGLSRMFHGGKA